MINQAKGKANKKMRSPNYPSIPLEAAIELARKLWDKNKQNAVAFDFALGILGYSPKSSAGAQALAALTAYGLFNVQGIKNERRVSISDLALKIILDWKPDSPSRLLLLREAALKPLQFTKIKEEYPHNPPAIDALIYDLPLKHKFNPNSAKDFASVFLKTMDYAKVYESDIIPDESKTPEDESMISQSETIGENGPAGSVKVIPQKSGTAAGDREKAMYSLGGDLKVKIIFSGRSPITSKNIEKLMNLLNINKEDFIETLQDDEETH